jgi:tRNA1Val (adenine37-N6)-methyltransferase
LRLSGGRLTVDLGSGRGWVAAFCDPRPAGSSCPWLLLDIDREALAAADVPDSLRACCDVRTVPSAFEGGIASVVVANPPYHRESSSRASPVAARNLARIAPPLTMAFFARAAAHLLVPGGEFRLVERPYEIEEALVTCRAFDLQPFEIQPFGEPGRRASLIRIRALRGKAPTLALLPQMPLPGTASPGATPDRMEAEDWIAT